MRKILVLAVIAAVAFACGTPKTVQESRKVIKGYWSLDEISYNKSGTFNVTLFSDTSKECFEGSTWRFIPNNNTGVYTINNGNCPTGDRNFIFDIQEMDPSSGLYDFLLKPTNDKGKSENSVGFRVRLSQLNESSMKWEQTVSLDGEPFKIYMNFSKIEE
ncbi:MULTISPECIES: lipocalin family protein [Altibacter]|uniref:lipocalin family protein n=1 Tax=Altibacter TaxID=1535231 RepID=UPI000557C8B5|nr:MULTISPECIES: lipocalin family protein [Altibacter]MCW8980172.1 lipocalin family protein [Altibacter sp.]MCW9037110.1 lipocalin family protein [Altibacter sp.]